MAGKTYRCVKVINHYLPLTVPSGWFVEVNLVVRNPNIQLLQRRVVVIDLEGDARLRWNYPFL